MLPSTWDELDWESEEVWFGVFVVGGFAISLVLIVALSFCPGEKIDWEEEEEEGEEEEGDGEKKENEGEGEGGKLVAGEKGGLRKRKGKVSAEEALQLSEKEEEVLREGVKKLFPHLSSAEIEKYVSEGKERARESYEKEGEGAMQKSVSTQLQESRMGYDMIVYLVLGGLVLGALAIEGKQNLIVLFRPVFPREIDALLGKAYQG